VRRSQRSSTRAKLRKMATKKKTKNKPAKSKRIARSKSTAMKAAKRPKKLAKKPAARGTKKNKVSNKRGTRKRGERLVTQAFPPEGLDSHSGDQSGDLQGLPRRPVADSESVEDLVEEGNAFEANAVIGVEDAGNAEGKEVRTHEVPEDDVPGEYLDED
jgi:hypothetical protein